MALLGNILKGSGTVKGVVTFRNRPPGFEWLVVVAFRPAEPGSQPQRGHPNPLEGLPQKNAVGFMSMETDRFELQLPAGHYHVIVQLRAALLEGSKVEMDSNVQFHWPVATAVEVASGQVKALNLTLEPSHPEGAEPPRDAWILTWLPGGKVFARVDGDDMPQVVPPSNDVLAALGKATRLENAGQHAQALAAWQEAESVIESLRNSGHLPLMVALGRARVLVALGRKAEALDTLQVHISPGRCLRWLPTPMALQLLITLGEASEDLLQVERFCALALLVSSHLPESAPEHERILRLREGLTRKLAAQSPEKALELLEKQCVAVEGATQGPDLYGMNARVVLLRKLGREPAALWLLTQVLQQLGASHPRRAHFEKLRAQFPPGPVSRRPMEETLSPAAVKRLQEGELGKRLMELVQENNLEELRRLHASGVSMDVPQAGIATPLMGAAHMGREEMVRFLLSAGANVHAQDENARTPLMHAADENRASIVRLLIQRGADVNALDAALQTPLHLACWQNHVDAMRELLRAGARVDMRDCTQRTPLMLAATEDVPEVITLLCGAGADVEAHDFQGNTALMIAAMEGRSRVVQVLLSRGARASTANRDGLTALDWAAQYQHQDTARLLRIIG
jgi:hypothetical protein